MSKFLPRIRRARLGVACALIYSCALIPAASARQSSSDDTASKKPTASKTTARKHHKPATKASSTTKPSSTAHTASSGKRSRKKSAKIRGQKKIDSDRARSIQEALIREHYLSGEPTGTWNQASEDAMRRYQADHGWQVKEVPDSRALIKLGLGPSKDHLLNPESAMTTGPDAPRAESQAPKQSVPSSVPASSPTDPPNPQ
jgi:Putative peptidoglycan binding domain